MTQVVARKEKINLSKMIQRVWDGNTKKVALQRECVPWSGRKVSK